MVVKWIARNQTRKAGDSAKYWLANRSNGLERFFFRPIRQRTQRRFALWPDGALKFLERRSCRSALG
jgi:hypothetical protein